MLQAEAASGGMLTGTVEIERRWLVLAVIAGLMAAAGVLLAALAAYVSRRRGTPAGISLAILLLAVAWWGLAYAVELSTTDLTARGRWGDLKYVGIGALPPAWLAFVLQYTGRAHLVTRRLVLLLAAEPLALLAFLANSTTHDWVRFYPPSAAGQDLPVVGSGPVFWVHLVYSNLLVLTATVLFVTAMVRVSRLYRRLSAILVAAALLPWLANALYNFEVGPFARLDLTPFVFVVTGAVLVWGLFRERLVNLTPVARGLIVETMADAVLVLDAFRRIVDANPAAASLLGHSRADLVGRPLADMLPGHPDVAPRNARVDSSGARVELTLPIDGRSRHFDARRQPLPDRGGAPAGELVVLRDITDHKTAEIQLRRLLAERTRVASALQASLLPATLPRICGVQLAGRYQPAGDGREIGGDFYDVFPVGPTEWGIVLGDVSGKGAEAAAVTALIRYTLRTLAVEQRHPCRVLGALNTTMLRASTGERYATLVYALARPAGPGLRLTICLGGHHQPLVLRADRSIEAVGRLGTALGLIDDPDLHDSEVDLGPGDLLCLFTDGLVEARRGDEQFGQARTAAVLREHATQGPDDVAAALDAAARRFRGGELTDDLALLVLRVEGSSGDRE